VTEYDVHMPFIDRPHQETRRVVLPLQQHAGVAAEPVIQVGAHVTKGQLIANVRNDQMGAAIHASIDGVIRGITQNVTIEA